MAEYRELGQSAGKRANGGMLGMALSLMTSHKATRYFTNAFSLQ
jgi:hypothetical protein